MDRVRALAFELSHTGRDRFFRSSRLPATGSGFGDCRCGGLTDVVACRDGSAVSAWPGWRTVEGARGDWEE